MLSLSDNNQADIIGAYNSTSRYLNDLINTDNPYFEETVSQIYEGCSNMNASSIITFFTYMLQQNGKRFYKGLYVTFKLAPDRKRNTVYLLSYSPLI